MKIIPVYRRIIVFLIVSVFGISWTIAQEDEGFYEGAGLTGLYLSWGGGYASTGGIGGGGFNVLFSNNMGGSMNMKFSRFEADNIPSDYVKGICLFGECNPYNLTSALSFNFMYKVPSTKSNRVRFGFEAGPTIVSYRQINFVRREFETWSGRNYDLERYRETGGGLALSVKMEFPIWHFLGFEVACFGNINSELSYMGIEIYLIVGKVRE
jgi:hypothetical protein